MLRKIFIIGSQVVAVSEVGSVDSDVTYPGATHVFVIDDTIAVAAGYTVDGANYIAPPPPPYVAPVAPVDPCEWLIDIGPFFDRFGATKTAILTSTDVGIKAIVQDTVIRKWIDLQRTDVISALVYIGSQIPAVDTTLQSAILTTPVAEEENMALRKTYFR